MKSCLKTIADQCLMPYLLTFQQLIWDYSQLFYSLHKANSLLRTPFYFSHLVKGFFSAQSIPAAPWGGWSFIHKSRSCNEVFSHTAAAPMLGSWFCRGEARFVPRSGLFALQCKADKRNTSGVSISILQVSLLTCSYLPCSKTQFSNSFRDLFVGSLSQDASAFWQKSFL